MRRSHTESHTTTPGVNLTPLIDMAFILVVFLVVTSSFVKEAGIEVNRPTAETAERQERGNIIIAVRDDGEIWMDGRQVDLRMVRSHVERLHAQNPEGTVIIMADEGSRTGQLVRVMDQVRLTGVTDIAIAATDEPR